MTKETSPETPDESFENIVLTRVEDGVGVISLNRPHRHNALNDDLLEAIDVAVEKVYSNSDVRAVIVRGEGKSLCSGRDLASMGSTKAGSGNGKTTHDGLREGQKRQLTILNSAKPSICIMRGYTVGAGFELALACDMRIAGENSQMWLPEIKMSVLPDLGGAHILASIAGPSRAKYIAMTGNRVNAEQALNWGVVDFVMPEDELEDYAMDLAKQLAGMPPIALGLAKETCDGLDGPGIRVGIQHEIASQMAIFGTEDFDEAMSAMRERRAPVFKGR